MTRWDGHAFDPQEAALAGRVFRPDVYRSALLGTGEPLPGASSKVEGSLTRITAVSTQQGAMVLEDNRFFDGRVFDPAEMAAYVADLP
jgi:NitT/TauT family transport system ATP-binding protein